MRLKQLLFNPKAPYREIGILILRIGYGIMFMGHGFPKIEGGPDTWVIYGEAMRNFGIQGGWAFWGLLAGVSEFAGGVLVGLGLLFRPACLMLVITMMIATSNHLANGDGFIPVSHPVEVGLVFLSFLLIGPGQFSLDQKIYRQTK